MQAKKGITILTTSVVLLACFCKSHNIYDLEYLLKDNFVQVNVFSGCIIRVLNFQGYNINGSLLNQPIVLLRYYSFTGRKEIYPYEIHSYNQTMGQKYFEEGKHMQYVESLYSFNETSTQKCNCEAEIFLEPPDREENPSLFIKSPNVWQIKHPYTFWFGRNLKDLVWKTLHVNTLNIYSVLVTATKMLINRCIGDICQIWAETVWVHPDLVKTNQQLLIWKVSDSFQVFVHCRFCDPCYPFLMIHVNTSNRDWLNFLSRDVSGITRQLAIEVVLARFVPMGFLWPGIKYRSRKAINFIHSFPKAQKIPPKVTHPVILSHILPSNASVQWGFSFAVDRFVQKALYISTCTNHQKIMYSPNLRPQLWRVTHASIARFQDTGLILDTITLRFLACHDMRQLWLSRLKELVTPFDATTWFLLSLSIFGLSLLIRVQLLKTKLKISYGYICFQVFAMFLEKGSMIFDWSSVRSKRLNFFVAFAIPFVLLVLSNEYRGDNISRLTIEPDLQPFDTFESLVVHKFPVYVVPRYLEPFDYSMVRMNVNVTNEFTKTSDHEWFPVVSDLWYEIMLQWTEWSTLRNFAHKISNRTWYYLNNSQIYHPKTLQKPNNFSRFLDLVKGLIHYDKRQSIEIKELRKCNRSAMMMLQTHALAVYTELKNYNVPVFFGKDIIYENMNGYNFFGQIPANLYARTKYLFQSGIRDFWYRYLDYLLVLRTQTNFEAKRDAEKKSESGVNILILIPGIGIACSFITFLFEIWQKIVVSLKTGFSDFYIKIIQLGRRRTITKTIVIIVKS